MHTHSPVVKIIGLAAWLITALVAINVGLAPFNFNFFATDFFQNNLMRFYVPILYLIGIAGIISLAMFIMACTSHCYKCGSKKCTCK
jgi:uncharacterized membrane protein YuzA (DUF378 family)